MRIKFLWIQHIPFKKIIRIVFIWFLWIFWSWRTELCYERNQKETVSVCSMLKVINSSHTEFKAKNEFFFQKMSREVELSWPRSVVFLKLMLSSQQSSSYTSLENNFTQYGLVPFSISKPNLFNSTDKWLTFTANSTMSFDSIPRATSPIAIATKTLSFRHLFAPSLDKGFAFISKERNYKINNWSLP